PLISKKNKRGLSLQEPTWGRTFLFGKGYFGPMSPNLIFSALTVVLVCGGSSVMLWGCMAWKGVGTSEFIETTMDAPYYRGIVDRNVKTSARKLGLRPFAFQQDNDPKHNATATIAFLQEKRIR